MNNDEIEDNGSISARPHTFARTCLLPMLGAPTTWYGEHLINVYIGDRYRPEYDENILVLLRYSNDIEFIGLEDGLRQHPNYVTDYDPTTEEVMLVFSVPRDFLEDYYIFKRGKYSRLSPRLKYLILGNDDYGVNYDILTRSPVRRKQYEMLLDVKIDENAELLDPPDPKIEVYGY